jgi:hypothetical protein
MADVFMGFGEPTGLHALARTLNLRFIPGEPDRQYRADFPDGLPEVPLFDLGGEESVTDIAYGTFGGLPLRMFTYHAVSYPDDPTHDVRSCVLFTIPATFSTLTVGPHTRLSRVHERDPNPFAQRFRVLGRDPEIAVLVLDAPMQRWLMAADEDLRIELSGSALLGHTALAEPDDLAVVLQQVYGTYLRIPDAAWARWGTEL